VGSASFSAEEAAQLRTYLDKGGFLWADDFWGTYAWDWGGGPLRKGPPPDEYPIVDITPAHPMFRALFDVKHAPQIPSIGFWASSGGGRSERGGGTAPAQRAAARDAM